MSQPGSCILILLVLGALAGCKSSAEPTAADDSLFVNTMSELRRIRADPALDIPWPMQAAHVSARDEALPSLA